MLLRQARKTHSALAWQVVDIADDDALFERYGWHIPVLRAPDGDELRWPFDMQRLQDFIGREAGA